MGSIKDIILNNNYQFFINLFRNLDRSLRMVGARIFIFSIFPKSIVDPAGISIIALIGFFIARYGNINDAIPFLAALALGAQKLIPQLQSIYQSWSAIRGSKGVLEKITKLLNNKMPDIKKIINTKGLEHYKKIEFRDISFRYEENLPLIISGLNLKIMKGDKIGIIGTTGSGKSTLLDLFMGFLHPTSGEIIVDNKILNNKNNYKFLTAWRLSIAYVPQMIFLTNASISENIAFGIPKYNIDMNRVKFAAKQAQISDFIESKEDGYDTKVGERGIKLSGGQRQRIGIARALYKNSSILILDEATSALDDETERSFTKAIGNLSLNNNLTVLVIAHRYSTLSHCNRIIELNNGRVEKEFKFKDLNKDSFKGI